jgi:exodeoxyribonuclease VII small subunit
MNSGPLDPSSGSGGIPGPSGGKSTGNTGANAGGDERFDELLVRLRTLVERLEGGNLPLEDGLRCFEEGMTLCKRGAEILDRAERRVEVLLGTGAEGARTAPFDTQSTRDDHG